MNQLCFVNVVNEKVQAFFNAKTEEPIKIWFKTFEWMDQLLTLTYKSKMVGMVLIFLI